MKTKPIIIASHLLLIILFGCLGWRLYYLQHCRADYYGDISYRARHTSVREQPERGRIYDSSGLGGRVLAASYKIQTVFLDPGLLPHWDDVMEAVGILQPILDTPAVQLCDVVYEKRRSRYVPLKVGITEAQRQAIYDAMADKDCPLRGVGIRSDWQRYWPMGQLTGTIVGIVGGNEDRNGPPKIGLTGIELQYQSILRGTEGKKVLVVDKHGLPVGSDPKQTTDVKNGSSLVLTIDTTIQEFARSELLKQYHKYRAESATAVVMDPWTGAILAMVSLPDYDPEQFSTADPATLRNRALTDPFEPGSIFKPIVAAIALDEGVITNNTQIFCENGYYAQYKIGEWAGHEFGNLTVKEILTESSNIGMAKIGLKMGDDKLSKGIKLFGFGARTRVEFPREEPGRVWPLPWDKMCLTRVPYGHQVSVTALQITKAFAVLANGGSLINPHLVRAIVDPEGKVTEMTSRTNLAGHVIKKEVADWVVRQALTNVVNEGTGKEAALENYQVFGKTGTANIAGPHGYDEENYTASFIGGAPAENPAVVMLVSIRKPDKSVDGTYSGGRIAAPVFREIMKKTLTYLEKKQP